MSGVTSPGKRSPGTAGGAVAGAGAAGGAEHATSTRTSHRIMWRRAPRN